MEFIDKQVDRLHILACADIDIESASKLAEMFVEGSPQFDMIILFGPFVHHEIKSEEGRVTAEGDIASIIAQFENIVCRVVYLASEQDPPNTLREQMHLTPNSINIHARRMNLTNDLFVVGFTEKSEDTKIGGVPPSDDRSAESDDELANTEVKSALSISIINEILDAGEEEMVGDGADYAEPIKEIMSGIFALNYKFSHTLNHFLFHTTRQLDSAGVGLSIISSASNRDEVTRLPKKFGNQSIAALKSLRAGFYTTIELEKDVLTNKWKTSDITQHSF